MTSSQITSDSWQMEGGERVGGPNVLPRWAIFTEEFPDTTGVTGAGIVTYSKNTFAYLNAEQSVAKMMIAAPDLLAALKDITSAFNTARIIMEDREARDLAGEIVQQCRAAIAKAEGRS